MQPDATTFEVIKNESGTLLGYNGIRHGMLDAGNNIASPYLRYFALYIDAKKPVKMLTIGGGACILPTWAQSRGIQSHIVEPASAVLDIAREHFFFAPNLHTVFMTTGETYLTSADELYDCIVLDAFRSHIQDEFCYSSDGIALCLSRLNVGGHLLINTYQSADNRSWQSISHDLIGCENNVFIRAVQGHESNMLLFTVRESA